MAKKPKENWPGSKKDGPAGPVNLAVGKAFACINLGDGSVKKELGSPFEHASGFSSQAIQEMSGTKDRNPNLLMIE